MHETTFYRKYGKRILDFCIALIALILLSPILLITAIVVRIKLGSPILFRQERPGLYNQIFTMYKFRTMTNIRSEDGAFLSDDERITEIGRMIRKLSLDELPELFNVLIGDMSIIGPRPLLVRYLPYYTKTEKIRSHVRPGMTGLAQINGRNALNWDNRFKLDVDYVQNLNFALDLFILFQTIRVVTKKKDILVGKEHILRDLDIERKWMLNDEESVL